MYHCKNVLAWLHAINAQNAKVQELFASFDFDSSGSFFDLGEKCRPNIKMAQQLSACIYFFLSQE